MPDFETLKPFLVLGLALGGVFAMSGVGLVVLYRATGVLNLAYGAVGAMGALISWSMIDAGSSLYIASLSSRMVALAKDERFEPSDAQRFKWQGGKWKIMPAPEPAH